MTQTHQENRTSPSWNGVASEHVSAFVRLAWRWYFVPWVAFALILIRLTPPFQRKPKKKAAASKERQLTRAVVRDDIDTVVKLLEVTRGEG